MENKKNEELADEALNNVTGGEGKMVQGWICCECHNEVWAAKAKDGKVYCISCFQKVFPDIPVV